MDNRACGPCPVELRVESERQAMDRKTNQHRIISWNSAAKEKSRMQGITRKHGMAKESFLVALTSKLEEMPSKAQREECARPRELHTWSLRDDRAGHALLFAVSVASGSFVPHGLYPARLLCPWGSPGKNTGVGCHFLLQGIFLTRGSNLCFLRGQADFLPLSYPGRFRPENRPLGSNTVTKGLFSND